MVVPRVKILRTRQNNQDKAIARLTFDILHWKPRQIKTLNRPLPLYSSRNIKKTVEYYVKSCRVFEQTKARSHEPKDYFQPLERHESKREFISIKPILRLPRTKNGKV